MYYPEIDNTYLEQAITRLQDMLAIATPNIKVYPYIDPNLNPPFWWLYQSGYARGGSSLERVIQTWTVTARFVVGYTTQGYDGNTARAMYRALPAAVNYIEAHKRLIYADDLDALPYLRGESVQVEQASSFGAFRDNTNHLGIELGIVLPFDLVIEQEF